MMTAKQWASRTFAAGHTRTPQLKQVDGALQAYTVQATPATLAALCLAIENWCTSKRPAGQQTGGYAALLKGTRNRSGAVQELVTDLRSTAGKPTYWPEPDQGSSYIVALDDATVSMLKDLRFDATRRSVMMIAAMDVDWASFAFDQVGSASSLAIGLGHTNYGSGWTGAQNNQTSLGQMESTTAGKILNICLLESGKTLGADNRVENVLKAAGLSINIVLGVLKFHLFKDGVMATAVPMLGPLKEAVDAAIKGGAQFRLASNSFQRVTAAKSLVAPTSEAATAIDGFEKLLKIETAKTAVDLAYRLLKDTALVVTEVLTLGAMTVVQVVTAVVEVIVAFVYQLVYSLVFRKSVGKCREWVQAGAVPDDLDFRAWIAACPLLGAYFLIGLSAGGGAVTALSMFNQSGEISSTDFQSASTKLLKVRQAAAAYVQDCPVKVKWTGPNGAQFKWIEGLIKSDALSASVGANSMKIHHWTLSDDASFKTRLKHKFHEHGNNVWSLAKTAWSVV
jgi:hypothetical protein